VKAGKKKTVGRVYRIEVRAAWTKWAWSANALGWPNMYVARERAEQAVAVARHLTRLGAFWADAEFRVTEVHDIATPGIKGDSRC